jgi:hypothetical protein
MKNNIVVVFSSHRNEEQNQDFIKHIDLTIGVRHKTICYPNFNQYSLTELYNQAMREHEDPEAVFVFCHNDIWFKTQDWGKFLIKKFNVTEFDIIGVAGSIYLHDNGVWWHDRSKMHGIVEHTNGLRQWVSEYSKPKPNYLKPVVLIDGLFMAVNPDNLVHRWDEDFKGFHLYDLSFCVPNYLDGCEIGVTTDIRILHESVGMTNDQWETNRKLFAEKYRDELPITYIKP